MTIHADISSQISPAHYQTASGIEAIDVIKGYRLGFHLGNVFKYISRCGKKTPDRTVDLNKALWYLKDALASQGVDFVCGYPHPRRPRVADVIVAFDLSGNLADAVRAILAGYANAENCRDAIEDIEGELAK